MPFEASGLGELTFLLPLIALVGAVVLFSRLLQREGEKQGWLRGATKICPDCAEHVNRDAKVCRFCKHRFGA